MAAPKKVTQTQLSKLINYIEEHKDVGLGTATGRAKGDEKYWLELATILNSTSGEPKTPSQWRRFWVEKKSQTRRKEADGKVTLTLCDKRILALASNSKQPQQRVRKQYDSSLEQAFISERAETFKASMQSAKKVSQGQLMKLINYMEKHKDIGLGSSSNSKEKEKYWEEITVTLNQIKGMAHTPSQWRRFWIYKKYRVLKKQNDGKVPLTTYERRLLQAAEDTNQKANSDASSEKSIKIEPEHFGEAVIYEDEGMDTDFVDSGSSLQQDCDDMSQDPMQDLNDTEPEVEVKYLQTKPELTRSEEIEPSWMRDVEERRLALEERCTIAMEQMAARVETLANSIEIMGTTTRQAIANLVTSILRLEQCFRSGGVEN